MNKEKEYWESLSKTFIINQANSLWRFHSDAVNNSLIDKWLPRGATGRVLKTDLFDEAVDNGMYPYLQSKSQDIFGIDLSSAIVNSALERHNNLKGTTADVRCLPFKDNTFDIIISISTLDHFKTTGEISDSLLELHRVLRVGGLLIITLDNHANPIMALRKILSFRLLNRLNIVPYYVGTSLTKHSLTSALDRTGFNISENTAIMHNPRVLSVALSRLLYKYFSDKTNKKFLRVLMLFERLSHWPTRYKTGYFIAALAVKR